MIKRTALCLWAAAFVLLSCVPVQAADTQIYKTYENKTEGISVKYPSEWRMQEGLGGGIVSFVPPMNKVSPIIAENVTVASQPLLGMGLDDYTKLNEQQFAGETGAELLESKPVKVSGRAGH